MLSRISILAPVNSYTPRRFRTKRIVLHRAIPPTCRPPYDFRRGSKLAPTESRLMRERLSLVRKKGGRSPLLELPPTPVLLTHFINRGGRPQWYAFSSTIRASRGRPRHQPSAYRSVASASTAAEELVRLSDENRFRRTACYRPLRRSTLRSCGAFVSGIHSILFPLTDSFLGNSGLLSTVASPLT